jgi:hypothetical protein
MNTNHLKKFAQSARKMLREDVSKRLLYWGIGGDGEVIDEPTRTSGGYIFRGDVYNDQSIPDKWNALVSAIKQHSLEDIIEEAAYTWFNRIIAIKILEKNGYDPEVLAYVSEELSDPVLLQNAKKGILPCTDPAIVADLKEAVLKSNDEELFSQLLIHHCKSHHLLNNIFGHIDDYTELLIPETLLSKGGLLELVNSEVNISDEDYGEVELIGWLYQFYISDKKDEVFAGFKKKKKARAEDIPAATQIFTPKWIVKYLVENTVGRLWLDFRPDSPIRETMKYLVEPSEPTNDDPIIKDVTELKVLDPAVGSGHFLVVAFDLLMQMYQEEGYTTRKAIQSIISNNLYGIDICPRAVGLANFAILLKAASHNADILISGLKPNIHAMPEPFDFQRQQVQDFLDQCSDDVVDEVHTAVKLLKKGQNIGSALILNLSQNARKQVYDGLSQDFMPIDLDHQIRLNRLVPYLQIVYILTDQYPAVVANPPYMGTKNMNADLAEYLKPHYPRSKSDLFAVFIEMMLSKLHKHGRLGSITMESWMFLRGYENLRKHLLDNYSIRSLSHFGWHIIGIAFGTVASILQNKSPKPSELGVYSYLTIDDIEKDSSSPDVFPKRDNGRYAEMVQFNFSKIPGSPIAYWVTKAQLDLFNHPPLVDHSSFKEGLTTANNDLFLRLWHEVEYLKISRNMLETSSDMMWVPYNKGGPYRKWYGNQTHIVDWRINGSRIKEYKGSSFRNSSYHFKRGSTFSALSAGLFSARYSGSGFAFDSKGTMFFSETELEGITEFLNSRLCSGLLELIAPTLDFRFGTIQRLPYLKIPTSNFAELVDISKTDWDLFETSWDFSENPLVRVRQVSIPLNESFLIHKSLSKERSDQLRKMEEQNNQAYIRHYKLDESFNYHVPLNEISLLCNPHYRYNGNKSENELDQLYLADTIRELTSYIVGCFMGRFRLDKLGLNIAHPNPSTEELLSYTHHGYTFEIDDDAIIPLMGSESPFSDDILQRVQQFVLMVWGEETYTENLNFINEALGENLQKFLTKKFWDFHKKMYKKRPIYWQFASPNGAFKVLTYMHRMNRFTVQVIRKNYLFKQMNWLEREIIPLVENEATLQTKESKRLDKLRKDLIECREYDLLLKDMADRQIEFDLDDGVVENYKLFEGVVSKI